MSSVLLANPLRDFSGALNLLPAHEACYAGIEHLLTCGRAQGKLAETIETVRALLTKGIETGIFRTASGVSSRGKCEKLLNAAVLELAPRSTPIVFAKEEVSVREALSPVSMERRPSNLGVTLRVTPGSPRFDSGASPSASSFGSSLDGRGRSTSIGESSPGSVQGFLIVEEKQQG